MVSSAAGRSAKGETARRSARAARRVLMRGFSLACMGGIQRAGQRDFVPPGEHTVEFPAHEPAGEKLGERAEGQVVFDVIDQPACVGAVIDEAVRMDPAAEWTLDLLIAELTAGDVVPVKRHPFHAEWEYADEQNDAAAIADAALGFEGTDGV